MARKRASVTTGKARKRTGKTRLGHAPRSGAGGPKKVVEHSARKRRPPR